MLRLRSLFRPQPQRPWTASYEIRLGRYRFAVGVTEGRLADLSRGEPHDRPDTVIDTDPDTLSHAVDSAAALATAVRSGQHTITGDRQAGQRLLDAAVVPAPA